MRRVWGGAWKRILATLVGGLLLSAPASGHGGHWRGPVDTIPHRTSPEERAEFIPDYSSWVFWWAYQRDRYLPRFRGEPRPIPKAARGRAVEALRLTLVQGEESDLAVSCLLALARIGERGSTGEEPSFERLLRIHLSSRVQRTSEMAALAMGFLDRKEVVEDLGDLAGNTPQGCELVGRSEVPWRTRAFAAVALGGIGRRTKRMPVRARIVELLVRVMERDDTKNPDLVTAAIQSMGLVPLALPDAESPREEHAPAEWDRIDQLDFLLGFLHQKRIRALARAHVPAALARLLAADGNPDMFGSEKVRVAKALLEYVRVPDEGTRSMTYGAILALGEIGDTDDDEIDVEIREALYRAPWSSFLDVPAQNFGIVSLARVGGRPGSGSESEVGIEEVAEKLLILLEHAKPPARDWAALGIGDMGLVLQDAGSSPELVGRFCSGLRSKLEGERANYRIAAYALALALLGDGSSGELLAEKHERMTNAEARGFVALALGIAGYHPAKDRLQAAFDSSKYRHDYRRPALIGKGMSRFEGTAEDLITQLLQQRTFFCESAAAEALGLLGDPASVEMLTGTLTDSENAPRHRSAAATALGLLLAEPGLPWYRELGLGFNYPAATESLLHADGSGILNIL